MLASPGDARPQGLAAAQPPAVALPPEVVAHIVHFLDEPEAFCLSRRFYAEGKRRLLPAAGSAPPPAGFTPLQQAVDSFCGQTKTMRRKKLRLAVARLAPPAARQAAWLGNMLPAPTPALQRQGRFAAAMPHAAQLSLAHAMARDFAPFTRLEGDPLVAAYRLCARLPGPREADTQGHLAGLLGGLLAGTGRHFSWEDRTQAWQAMQAWLARPRQAGQQGGPWAAQDTAALHDLLCMLGHDPLGAWLQEESHLLRRAWADRRRGGQAEVDLARRLEGAELALDAIYEQALLLIFGTRHASQPLFPDLTHLGYRPRLLLPLLPSLTTVCHLELIDLQLTDLPLSLSTLTRLQTLTLESNRLTALPQVAAHWPALCSLSLVNNCLAPSSAVPGGLAALTHLSVKSNNLTAFPTALLELTALRRLDVGFNPLGELPAALTRLSAMTQLVACGVQLHTVPSWAQHWPTLHLDLRHAEIRAA